MKPAANPDTASSSVKMHPSWLERLGDEFDQKHMQELRSFIKTEIDSGKKLHPQPAEYFAAFDATPFNQVRVVILGQDPYHGEGQAHGLCFSVRDGVSLPPSLVNIYKELEADLGLPRSQSGYLMNWAKQGVLLLNSVLTVRDGQAASHQGKGWELFTDRAIRELSEKREGVVFVLWGAYAQKKGAVIDRKKHFVIESPHPSPLSAHRGFLGSKPFSKINAYLERRGETPIDWSVS
ncbi:MAG: uracil-DNA glycosylase [Bdellovibrionales bacterium]|nr:uracil-DNA glycosylase [Bdellovibrionales bacterium]